MNPLDSFSVSGKACDWLKHYDKIQLYSSDYIFAINNYALTLLDLIEKSKFEE